MFHVNSIEYYVTDRVIIPSCKVRHREFIGAYELADIEVKVGKSDIGYVGDQIELDDGFNNF